MLRVADEIKKSIEEYDRKKGGHKKVMSYLSSYSDNNDIKALRAIHNNIGDNEKLTSLQWRMLLQLFKERSKNQKHTSFKLLSKLEKTLFGSRAEKVINHSNPTRLVSFFVLLSKHDLLTKTNCMIIAGAKNPKIAYDAVIDRTNPSKIAGDMNKKLLGSDSDSESSSEVSRASAYESRFELNDESSSESSLGFSSDSSEESSGEESIEKNTGKANNDVMVRDLLKSLKSRNQLTEENRGIVMAEKNPKVLWAFKILVEGNVFTPKNIQAIKTNQHPIDMANSYRANRLHNMFGGAHDERGDKIGSHRHEEREKKIPKL